jgi:hypothetical protein
MLGMAIAAFHWTPQTFWKATPHEWYAAAEALERMNRRPHDGDD